MSSEGRYRKGGSTSRRSIPLWLKTAFTAVACVVLPVYWYELGPKNFLWFSDIALIVMVPALWLESRLLASTMAVGVLMLELVWLLDFASGGNLFQLTAYMFDPESRHIDVLSGLFHFALIFTLPYTLARLGYDRRALWVQTLLALVVLPVTYLVTGPDRNINWVYGFKEPQETLPQPVYLVLLILAYVFLVYVPSHFIFKRLFSARQ